MTKQLTRSNVFVATDAIVVQQKWSKVVQNAERLVQIPLKSIPGSVLCPKNALLNVVSMSKASQHDHLFSYLSDTGIATIIQSEFVTFLH